MNHEAVEMNVEILGRIYPIKCARSEVSALQNAVKHLEERLQLSREANAALDSYRLVMVTALNLVHELLAVNQQQDSYVQWINKKLQGMQNKIDGALTNELQMEFDSAE